MARRLVIDAVGLSTADCAAVAPELIKIYYERGFDIGEIILATDHRGGDRYVAHAANCLRQAQLPQSTTGPLYIKEAPCSYTCICRNHVPTCGRAEEHEVYAAPCQCESGDWLLMAKCCCGEFRQGICTDHDPPDCRCINEGVDVARCFKLFKCPRQ